MTEVIRYIADDGKVFEEESDCKAYELTQRHKSIVDDLLIYDENGFQLDLADGERTYNIMDYIVIKSKAAYHYLVESAYCYYGFSVPNEEDVANNNYNASYYYNYDCDRWVNIKDEIDKYKWRIEELSKYL